MSANSKFNISFRTLNNQNETIIYKKLFCSINLITSIEIFALKLCRIIKLNLIIIKIIDYIPFCAKQVQ